MQPRKRRNRGVAPGFVKGLNVLSCLRALPHAPQGAYYCLNQSAEHLSCSVDVLIQCLFSHVLKPEHVHPSLSPCWDHCRKVAFEDSSCMGVVVKKVTVCVIVVFLFLSLSFSLQRHSMREFFGRLICKYKIEKPMKILQWVFTVYLLIIMLLYTDNIPLIS